jgi:outer membrane protein assembly factor BamB
MQSTSQLLQWLKRGAWLVGALLILAAPKGASGETPDKLQSWWRALGDADTDKAFAILLKFERADDWAGRFLARQLRAAPEPAEKAVRALAANLSSRDFHMRQAAYQRLSRHGAAIQSLLQQEMDRAVTAEARIRIGRLLYDSRDLQPRNEQEWRVLRALRVLERRGDEVSRRVLQRLAGGAQGARITEWAGQARSRLVRRRTGQGWAAPGANPGRTSNFATRGIRGPAELAWQFDLGEFRYPATAMVVRDGVAYLAVDHGDEGPHLCSYVYAIDLQAREVIWRHGDLRTMVRSAPALADDQLYFVSLHDSMLVCLDATDGSEKWRYRFSAGLQSEPLPAGPTVLVCGDDNVVHAIDTQFGKQVWSRDCQAPLNWAPAVSGDAVLVPAGNLLYRLDLATGRIRWKHEARYQVGAPAVDNGTIYTMTCRNWKNRGKLLAIELGSGRTRWQVPIEAGAPYAPAVGHSSVFAVAGDRRELWAVRAESGRVQWHMDLDQPLGHSPALAGGMLYAVGRREGTLICLDPRRGSTMWQLETGGSQLPGPPAIEDGMVYVPSKRRTLCAVTEVRRREKVDGPVVAGDGPEAINAD